jgi:hypothetical protein
LIYGDFLYLVAMVNHTQVKALSAAHDDAHGIVSNFSSRVECEAEPPKPGASAGNQVCQLITRLIKICGILNGMGQHRIYRFINRFFLA